MVFRRHFYLKISILVLIVLIIITCCNYNITVFKHKDDPKHQITNIVKRCDMTGKYLTLNPNPGRLGNQLFLYCSALGLADLNNMTLLLPNYDLSPNGRFLLQNVFELDHRKIEGEEQRDRDPHLQLVPQQILLLINHQLDQYRF